MTLIEALNHEDAGIRLKAALAIGTTPDPAMIDALVARCAVEPDFYVRDTLTWAITRHDSTMTLPRVLEELASATNQARSQALHTLSKIKDPAAWPAITPALLRDADDEVARSAWRAAVVLVPDDERASLARELASQFGRGSRDVQRSLSRALVSLGEDAVAPVLHEASSSPHAVVRAHAAASERLLHDPDASFELAVDEAKRIVALGS